MSVIKDENFFQISGFMINRLELKGISLMVYAIIYGFSQDGESEFTGSRKFLCEFTGATKPTIDKALNDLCKANLIIKSSETKNGVIFNRYKVNLDFIGSKETLPPSKETLQGGSKETLPNNININNINNNINKENIYIKEKYGQYGRVKLTLDEYNRLVNEFNKEYIDNIINSLDEYVESNNNKNKYTNYNLVIRKAIRENWFKIDNQTSSDDNGGFKELQ